MARDLYFFGDQNLTQEANTMLQKMPQQTSLAIPSRATLAPMIGTSEYSTSDELVRLFSVCMPICSEAFEALTRNSNLAPDTGNTLYR